MVFFKKKSLEYLRGRVIIISTSNFVRSHNRINYTSTDRQKKDLRKLPFRLKDPITFIILPNLLIIYDHIQTYGEICQK